MSKKETVIMSVGEFSRGNIGINAIYPSNLKYLSDADIVVVRFDSTMEPHHLKHWESEFKKLLEIGKNIFIFCPKIQPTLQGYTNYDFLNINEIVKPDGGKSFEILEKSFINNYWSAFGNTSEYRVHLNKSILFDEFKAILQASNTKNIVGAILKCNSDPKEGNIVLLPDYIAPIYQQYAYQEECQEFFDKILTHIKAMDKALKKGAVTSPAPDWANNYKLPKEIFIESQIDDTKQQIEELSQLKEKLELDIIHEQEFKKLLYETSSDLENIVKQTLELIGFDKPQSYDDGKTELDIITESPEGTLLGEVEGKSNNKQVDNMKALKVIQHQNEYYNIYQKDPDTTVLFGNIHRNEDLSTRPTEYFTDKCRELASKIGFALVRTPDLFEVVKYIEEHPNDDAFKKACREALFNTKGNIVKFPIPAGKTLKQVQGDVPTKK